MPNPITQPWLRDCRAERTLGTGSRRAYKTCRAMRPFIETKYAFDDIAQVNREVDKALPGRDIPGPRSYSGRG
jgi:hypothetical protein